MGFTPEKRDFIADGIRSSIKRRCELVRAHGGKFSDVPSVLKIVYREVFFSSLESKSVP